MALIKADRVKEITATIGTGAFTLAGAVSTYRTFASVMDVNDTCYYTAINAATGEWETGQGCLTGSTTLARGYVFAGSNGTSKVNFTAGSKEVFMSIQASHIVAEHYFTAANYTTAVGLVRNLAINDSYTTTGKSFSSLTVGTRNIAIGAGSLGYCETSSYSVGIGNGALYLAGNSNRDVAIGYSALTNAANQIASPGSFCRRNVVIGAEAAEEAVSLEDSVLIGKSASPSTATTNVICIGANSIGNGDNTATIGNSNTTDCHIHGNVVPTKGFKPASLADSAAPNNAIYYSTTASKLVYKDSGGTVNNLY